jgi:competence protein ComEC
MDQFQGVRRKNMIKSPEASHLWIAIPSGCTYNLTRHNHSIQSNITTTEGGSMRRVIVGSVFAILSALLVVSLSSAQPASTQTTSFINVGQGDAALLQDGSGFDVLIDGGVAAEGPTVDQFLRDHGATDLDVMLASHADADHIGGLITVLQDPGITIHKVLYNGYPGTTATWTSFFYAANERGLSLTAVQFPSVQTWGGMTAYVLNPAAGLSNPETNDASLVVRVDAGAVRELFTGDIDGAIEATVVARQTPLAADILKVPHHGSAYSSSALFLAAVHPHFAVISVGQNSYGHPSADTIDRLQAAGAAVYRTDRQGVITAANDNGSLTISPALVPSGVAIYLPLVRSAPPPPVNPTPVPSALPTQAQTPTLHPNPTQAPTSLPNPTQTSIPTPTTIPTQSAPVTNGNVVITTIFYDGTGSVEPDEYVEIHNADTRAVQIQNWTLSDAQSHIFTFPAFVMDPGKICRVYTNQIHQDYCGFSYGSGSAIWNNSGDTATLKDANGQMISQKGY